MVTPVGIFRLYIHERAEGVRTNAALVRQSLFSLGVFFASLFRAHLFPLASLGVLASHFILLAFAAPQCSHRGWTFFLNFLSGRLATQRRPWVLYMQSSPHSWSLCVWNEFTLWCARRLLFALCHAHFLLAGPWAHGEDSWKRNLAPFVSLLNER